MTGFDSLHNGGSQRLAALFVQFQYRYAFDVIVCKNFAEFGHNIKIGFHTADQGNLSFDVMAVERFAEKCAAIRRDQQMGMMIVGRNNRRLPQLDRPLGRVAAHILEESGMETIYFGPRILVFLQHMFTSSNTGTGQAGQCRLKFMGRKDPDFTGNCLHFSVMVRKELHKLPRGL